MPDNFDSDFTGGDPVTGKRWTSVQVPLPTEPRDTLDDNDFSSVDLSVTPDGSSAATPTISAQEALAKVRAKNPDLAALADVDSEDVGAEYLRIPALIAYYSSIAAVAQKKLTAAERTATHEEAKLYLATRERLENDPSIGRVTEGLIAAHLKADPQWVALREAVDAAVYAKQAVQVHLETLRARRDMIVSYGALKRAEINAQTGV